MRLVRLGVNIDHVATLRQARRGSWPDPVEAARVCERAGASSIVCHLREDRRHIQDDDVRRLREAVTTRLNLEMSIAEEIVRAAVRIKPNQVTLVPERRQELTTEGGLNAVQLTRCLVPIVARLRQHGVEVSLFIDPARPQLEAAHRLGVPIVELHTGRYANARTVLARARQLRALRQAGEQGRTLGLRVAAGHGLDYDNVRALMQIPEIEELNIGYSIVSRALFIGMERAVAEMIELLQPARAHAVQAV